MARFDLYRVNNWRVPLMVNVQAELLDDFASRAVIPLQPIADASTGTGLPRLNPVLDIGGEPYLLATTDLAAHPLSWLGSPVGNIKQYRDEITVALDFLFQGF